MISLLSASPYPCARSGIPHDGGTLLPGGKSTGVMMARTLVTLGLVFVLAATAEAQAVVVVAGRSVGPIRLGMTTSQVQRIAGRPASRVGDALWTYERPINMRVEFQAGRVKSLTTWDPRARTAQGLTIGAPQAAVVMSLGAVETLPAFPGVWLYNRITGLAVYVQGGFTAAFTVVAPVAVAPGPPAPGPRPPTP